MGEADAIVIHAAVIARFKDAEVENSRIAGELD